MTMQPDTTMPDATTEAPADRGEVRGMSPLATFTEYAGARDLVDQLSDSGFDVGRSAIIWHGLRRVERVTGRRTVWTAAGEGALAGAWFGSFFGLLLALFADVGDSVDVMWTVLAYLVSGAALGAIWFGGVHWSTRGQRDFSSVGVLDADRFEVVVAPDLLAEAQRINGITDSRAVDPTPAGQTPPR